jgi:SEC-C motif-containing protein
MRVRTPETTHQPFACAETSIASAPRTAPSELAGGDESHHLERPMPKDCPCGSGERFEACCGQYLDGGVVPPTAEALMRSRYTAYALERAEYIVETHHPETRDEAVDIDAVREWAEEGDFQSLQILSTSRGGEDDDEGEVEFAACFRVRGRDRVHRERSTFKRKDGRWYFHHGVEQKAQAIVREGPKVGRNDPCPCGSGKKHKKCCGQRGAIRG